MKTSSFVSHEDALDIVFANRNRAYGAYQIRRAYPDTLLRAFLGGLAIIGVFLAMPHVLNAFVGLTPETDDKDGTRVITDIIIPPPPPIVPPPVPPTPPPPARATQRFVPPLVEEDEKVIEDPSKRSVDDLLEDPSAIGTKNIEGPDEGPPSIDEPGLGLLIETPPAVVEEALLEMFDVQKPPSFPGGEAALMRFLAENIKYPDMAREAGIQGVVVVSFVVGKDGNINDIALLKEVGGGCSKEALRVVKTMPRWSPGEAQGHAVKVRFTLPVRFALQ